MSTLLEYKCPNCAGAIKFDSVSGQFKCESCESTFSEEQLKKYNDELNNFNSDEENPDIEESNFDWSSASNDETLEGMNTYSCQSCGAQIVTDATTAASECPYCNSPIIMTQQVAGVNKPDCVIPFKLDSAGAQNALKDFCKKKPFLPKAFKADHINEFKGVYVPFWLFDSDVNASIAFDATRTRVWSDSKFRYTETSFFDIYRAGRMRYEKVPVDGSSKMDDAYMDGIEPFDYSEMIDFNPAYLSGFMADKYDVDAEHSFERANSRIKATTEDEFAKTVSGYEGVRTRQSSIQTQSGVYKYALLPVWILNVKYGGKLHMFAVNGQTGRVSGKLPIDKKKFWGVFAGIAAAVIAIGQLFVF